MTTETNFNPFKTDFNQEELIKNLNRIDAADIRARFKNTQDPITLAFKTLDNAPLGTLAKDFVKDTFFDFVSFVTELCK